MSFIGVVTFFLILFLNFISIGSIIQTGDISSLIVENDTILIQKDSIFELDHSQNNLRINFGASPGEQFQYKLQGFQDDWSPWTNEYYKDYTNLPDGDYVFLLRSRNEQGQVAESSYAFSIKPPWYRNWWAYFLFIVVFYFILLFIVNWRSNKLIKEKEALEERINQATDKLQQQAKKLEEMDNLKSRFFANISHEFRTPLTLLIGPLEKRIMEDGHSPEVQMMLRNARKLLRLINQLLDLSRLEAGNMVLNLKKGYILKFLQQIASQFNSMADLKKIKLISYIPEDKCPAYFDPGKFEDIMVNLLSNALKFTPTGGKVTVEAKPVYEKENPTQHNNNGAGENIMSSIRISVEDTGLGIKSEDVYRLFDRFYQEDTSDSRDHEGSGIGLALVKELVDLHGGMVTVDSNRSVGAKFTVTLPVHKKFFKSSEVSNKEVTSEELKITPSEIDYMESDFFQESVTPDKQKIEFESLKNEPLILIVEDNEDIRYFIKDNLDSNFVIKEASNGLDGLALAIETVPDLIIADLMMPKMNGVELCEKLKTDERTSHIPIIMLTAKAGTDDKIEGLETGADDYLTKPFNVRELQTRVKNLIEQRKKLRERYGKHITLEPKEVEEKGRDEEFIVKAAATIEENIADPGFSVDLFQKEMGMSRMQLHRKLKALTEKSTSEFIRYIKLQKAAQLLLKQTGTVAEIAYEVGFTDPSYFTKCFRQEFGVSPSEYTSEKQ